MLAGGHSLSSHHQNCFKTSSSSLLSASHWPLSTQGLTLLPPLLLLNLQSSLDVLHLTLDEADPLHYRFAPILPGKEDALVLFEDPADLSAALLFKLLECHGLGWRGAARERKENTHRCGAVGLSYPVA